MRKNKIKIYLDNCLFNRPFDEQSHIRIRIETEAKLAIQEEIRRGTYQLIWSYILDYENSKNPFRERQEQIMKWKKYAITDIEENTGIIKTALLLNSKGLQKMDSLHIACAIFAKADYFLTTDDKVIKKANAITELEISDPINFIKKVFP
ncbi:MAG: PIN domain protein [Methylococcales bacterium]|nr:PIN domain protein [Methylococcales bacterium]